MVTVHRASGFRFVIFANDHAPPHVHVFGQGGEALITIDDPKGPTLEWFVGLTRADVRRIFAEVEARRVTLLKEWTRIHGGTA